MLDLGTGCGVQALHASRHARAGHRHRRRAARARAGARPRSRSTTLDVELLDGPVAGAGGRAPVRPDRLQPAVRARARAGRLRLPRLGPGRRRRARRAGRATCRRTSSRAAWRSCSASWLHVRGEDWPDRVRSWLPDGRATRGSCSARWPTRRCTSAPGSATPGSTRRRPRPARRPARGWTGWTARAVEAVGFGLLTLRRTDGAADRGVRGPAASRSTTRSGPEVEGWLDRVDWLRGARRRRRAARRPADAGAVACCWSAAPEPGAEGWSEVGAAVARRGRAAVAPRGGRARPPRCWRAAGARCRCGELVELLAIAHDRPTDALVAATLPAVREFVRHGLLVPAGRERAADEGRRRAGQPGRRCGSTARSSARSPGPACWCCSACTATTPPAAGAGDGPQAARAADPRRGAVVRRDGRAAAGGQPVHALRRHPQGPPAVLVGRGPARPRASRWWTRSSPRCGRAARRWRPGCSAPTMAVDVGERRAVHGARRGVTSGDEKAPSGWWRTGRLSVLAVVSSLAVALRAARAVDAACSPAALAALVGLADAVLGLRGHGLGGLGGLLGDGLGGLRAGADDGLGERRWVSSTVCATSKQRSTTTCASGSSGWPRRCPGDGVGPGALGPGRTAVGDRLLGALGALDEAVDEGVGRSGHAVPPAGLGGSPVRGAVATHTAQAR